MKKYESVILFDGLLSEDEIKALQEKVHHIITQEGGEVAKMDFWGKRRLAFDIKRRREGYYLLIYFSAQNPAPVLFELDRFCRIEEKVLRHIICHELPLKDSQPPPLEKEAEAPREEKAEQEEQGPPFEGEVGEHETEKEVVETVPTPEEESAPPEEESAP